MDEYDYDAAASTVEIEDITTNHANRSILRRLEGNIANQKVEVNCFDWQGDRELGWLGYFIGKNTTLRELCLYKGRARPKS